MPTKTDSIRDLFLEKGFGLMPTDAVQILKKQGVKVQPQQVSTVKYQMKQRGEQPNGPATRTEDRPRTGNGVGAKRGSTRTEAGAETLTLTWAELEELKALLSKHGKAKLLRLVGILAD